MTDTASTETGLAPTAQGERWQSLDVLRGIAVLGILAANIWTFAFPPGMATAGGAIEGGLGLSPAVWLAFIDSSMRTLFSILFGAGMVMFMERMEARNMGIRGADLYFRRILILLVMGLINAFVFMWIGDILFMYAVLAFVIYGLRNTSTKWLFALISLLLIFNLNKGLSSHDKQMESYAAGAAAVAKQDAGETLDSSEESAAKKHRQRGDFEHAIKTRFEKNIEKIQSGFAGSREVIWPWSVMFQSRAFYNYFALDCLISMLLGIILFRHGFLTGAASWKALMVFTSAGLAVGLVIRLNYYNVQVASDFTSPDASFWRAFNDFSRIGLAIGYLGLVQMLCKAGLFGWLRHILAATGQMALTNYLMQSILCGIIFLGWGFGLYGTLRGVEPWYVVAAICALQLAWSPIWLKYFRFGPFEWAWRSLTYGTRQPLKRSGSNTEATA